MQVETLTLARIHEAALVALGVSKTKNALTKPAGIFFTAVNSLIEKTRRPARETKTNLKLTPASPVLRTDDLAVSRRELQRGIARRKAMADAAEKNGRHYQKSLKQSLQLQKRLRQLTHRVIEEQEESRKHISHGLQDEIAQTLLGINVRLLSLKEHARNNTKSFRDEIASTQRLVLKSAQSVRRVAREIGQEPEKAS